MYNEIATERLQSIINSQNIDTFHENIADLLGDGANPNTESMQTGQNYLELLCDHLYYYCDSDDQGRIENFLKIFDSFLAFPNFNVNHHDFGGISLIHKVIKIKNIKFLQHLLDLRGRDVDVNKMTVKMHGSSFFGSCAIHDLCTSLYPRRERFEILLAHGANPNLLRFDGKGPIHILLDNAVFVDMAELTANIMVLMQNGGDPDLRVGCGDMQGTPPLHYAIFKRSPTPVFRALLRSGASLKCLNSVNFGACTPLEYAVRLNYSPAVCELMLDFDADADRGLQLAIQLCRNDIAQSIRAWQERQALAKLMLERDGMHYDLSETIMAMQRQMP